MRPGDLSLGIDTSNYKTSVAVKDRRGNILFDKRIFLTVKKGERGLRQSEALFQHTNRLPDILSEALENENIRNNICRVCVSSRPRPVDGSYMPVFLAGISAAKCISSALNVPLYRFSHQEGHMEAVRFYSPLSDGEPAIYFHFSGGTTEALLQGETIKVVGGSKDLSYGQVLDRVGVCMGLEFPCGEALDKMAAPAIETGTGHILSKIKVRDGYVNLSGIETQAGRALRDNDPLPVVSDLFQRLSLSILEMMQQLSEKYDVKNFIYMGGVSASSYLRDFLSMNINPDLNIIFGSPELSCDNAVGISLLGGKKSWR